MNGVTVFPPCTALPPDTGASFSQGTQAEKAEPNARRRLDVGREVAQAWTRSSRDEPVSLVSHAAHTSLSHSSF